MAAVDLHFFYGDHLRSLNRIADARTHLERAIAISTRSVIDTSSTYHSAVCLHLCRLAEENTEENFDAETDALRWRKVLDTNIIVTSARVAWSRLMRDAHMNVPERCRYTFDSFGIHPSDLTMGTHALVWLATLAGAVLGRAPGDAKRITAQLSGLCDRMENEHNFWLSHRARAVLSAHLLACGDEDGACRAIQPLLTRADCHRLLLDLPPLARFMTTPANPVELLSDRECDVLRWFATNHTNKEIAHALCISLHTLYAHTQKIYRKLNVHSREEALQVWRKAKGQTKESE